MAKLEGESDVEFVKPSLLDTAKQKLLKLEKAELGSYTTKEAIQELLPMIKGCRNRGHSWQRIAELLEDCLPKLTANTLRKIAQELEPSLKGTTKGVNSTQAASSAVPELEEEEEATEDEVWPPADVEDDQEDEDEEEEETSEPEITITSGRRSKV